MKRKLFADKCGGIAGAGWLAAALMFFGSGALVYGTETTSKIRSYAYVLQAETLAETRAGVVGTLTGCDRDWIVLDAFFTGGPEGRWTPEEIETIRRGKSGRKVIGYLSIAEAEDYREYWQASWGEHPPAFLLGENPHWPGNFRVRYWDALWQQIVLRELRRMQTQGFDGVLLDIVDGFEFFEQEGETIVDHKRNPLTGNTYRQDMIRWVRRIAQTAREGAAPPESSETAITPARPGFLVIPQNATQLLSDPVYAQTISAQALEDLFTNGDQPQPAEHGSYILGYLRPFLESGKPVMLTEYAQEPQLQAISRRGAAQYGLTLLLTDRALSTLGHSSPSVAP